MAHFLCFYVLYRLLFMRNDAFTRVGDGGPNYIIDTVDDDINENIYRLKVILMLIFASQVSYVVGVSLESCLYQSTSVVSYQVLIWLLTMSLDYQPIKGKLMSHLRSVIRNNN